MEKIVHTLFKRFNLKDTINKDLAKYDKTIEKAMKAKVPKNMFHSVTHLSFSKGDAYLLEPKQPKQVLVFYLHGGAYLYGIARHHWTFLKALMDHTACSVLVPNYPLHHYAPAHELLSQCYDWLHTHGKGARMILMGDSAGGGMAMGFSQTLLLNGQKLPSHILLLSPWLDISMTDDRLKDLEPKDPILCIKGLKTAGDYFSKGIHDHEAYLVSPIKGPLKGLPPIAVFTGTHDLLNVDAHRLRDRALDEGISLSFYEEEERLHDYMLFPFKASKACRQNIFDILNRY